jgi:hypothetical protein
MTGIRECRRREQGREEEEEDGRETKDSCICERLEQSGKLRNERPRRLWSLNHQVDRGISVKRKKRG